MKENIFELGKKFNHDRILAWWWVKNELEISRYFFHKYCNELVAEGRLKKKKWSNVIGYELITQKQ